MRVTPRLILRFIDRHGGWVNDYPLIEFFGAMQIVDGMIRDGHLEKSPRENGWSKYALTDSGRALILDYDPIAAGDLAPKVNA
jgi:hypothetical protein